MSRTVIRPRDRFEILQRDGFMCRYCGCQPGETELQIDHIKPISQGGTNSLLNLITSCRLCNAGKGANPVDFVPIPHSVIEEIHRLRHREQSLIAATQSLIELRKQRFQDAVDMVGHALGLREIRNDHAKHVMYLIEEYGPDAVDEWLQAAFRRTIPQTNLLKYLYGCARNHRKTEVNNANS